MNLEKLLLKVEKPARYIGNEINVVDKDISQVDIRFAFCFPDTYEIGMSHLGMQILYFLFNSRKDIYCERIFAPWIDMEEQMRLHDVPLFSLETLSPITDFNFIGFTLQYEMSYTNILNMLNLGNIPFLSKDRGEEYPIICAGGPCSYNPEPLADIVDFFYIGEGEVAYDLIFDLYIENKKNSGTKNDFLQKLLQVEGVYVPKFYDVTYHESGEIASFEPNHPNAMRKIKKLIVKDLDSSFYPDTQLVPLIEVVHDRVTLEIFRGCIRGCRFCQAGYVYRPVREKNTDTLINQAKRLVTCSGHDEISLASLSTGDYSQFKQLSEELLEQFAESHVNLSLPSLRIDAFNLELMSKVQAVRKSSLTFAPEAGTQRLRDVINKGITEQEILDGSKLAFEGGWNRIKLYFMVGLPTESMEDVMGISQLTEKIVNVYHQLPPQSRRGHLTVSTSVSCFVPKPFTPFQWVAQDTEQIFLQKTGTAKRNTTKKQVRLTYHEPAVSVLEAVLARGDRRVSQLIIKAWELGAKFDAWTDMFDKNIWEEALTQTNISKEFYAHRKRSYDEILPWDHIDIGIPKEYFIKEAKKAELQQITPNCKDQCSGCGMNNFKGGVCFE